jgi:hypothetical protein
MLNVILDLAHARLIVKVNQFRESRESLLG